MCNFQAVKMLIIKLYILGL